MMRYCVTGEVIVEPSCSVYAGEGEEKDMEGKRERDKSSNVQAHYTVAYFYQ